jgi:hypothetical protein
LLIEEKHIFPIHSFDKLWPLTFKIPVARTVFGKGGNVEDGDCVDERVWPNHEYNHTNNHHTEGPLAGDNCRMIGRSVDADSCPSIKPWKLTVCMPEKRGCASAYLDFAQS